MLSLLLIFSVLSCDDGSAPKTDHQELSASIAAWSAGMTAPEPSRGVDGDLYLQQTSGRVYVKIDGTWVLSGSIRRADGHGTTSRSTVFEMLDHVILAPEVVPYWQKVQPGTAAENSAQESDSFTVRDAETLSRLLQSVTEIRRSRPASSGEGR